MSSAAGDLGVAFKEHFKGLAGGLNQCRNNMLKAGDKAASAVAVMVMETLEVMEVNGGRDKEGQAAAFGEIKPFCPDYASVTGAGA